jgi:hypothetical protein
MEEDYPLQMLLAEHVLWCCGERDSMAWELIKYKERLFSARQCKDGNTLTGGAATHLAYLKSAIQHLDKFVAASSAAVRDQESQPIAGEPMHGTF